MTAGDGSAAREDTSSRAGAGPPAANWIIHAFALGLAIATLWLVGQPIYANDTWVHLALGGAFATEGPWLAADPFLFAAPGPPAPSSWLGSWTLHEVQALSGFVGLRVFHVFWVALILVLAWWVLRRTSRSTAFASAGLVGFILLSTYRIVQLRPHLFTIAAMLAIYLLVLAPRRGPRARAIVAAAVLSAVWANFHAAFLLGPVLVLGCAGSLMGLALLPGLARPTGESARAVRVAWAGGAMLLASCLNPQGLAALAAYFSSGAETLPIGTVADEWGPTNLLAWPVSNLPPTPAAWLVCWISLGIVVVGAVVLLRARARAEEPVGGELGLDPVLVALAAAGVVGSILASRFLWLLVFALALLGVLSTRRRARRASRVGLGWVAVTAAVLFLHIQHGDWLVVSRGLRSGAVDYREPYRAAKYFGHAMWFLEDTGVTGRIYNDYPLGGFMSFWLSPRLEMASGGSMNVERSAMEANLAIGARTFEHAGLDFAGLLDDQAYDLFLATGLPVAPRPGRPITSTLRHLEGESGWIPVFRSLRSAVYLRAIPRNRGNLERIAAHYARAGVPFDPRRGFDAERTIAEAPQWSIANGLVPEDFATLRANARAERARGQAGQASHRLAELYAVLGFYERALEIDGAILEASPRDGVAFTRRRWCLLQLGRFEAVGDVVASAEERAFLERLAASPADQQRAWLAQLPLFEVDRARAVQSGVRPPTTRSRRPTRR